MVGRDSLRRTQWTFVSAAECKVEGTPRRGGQGGGVAGGGRRLPDSPSPTTALPSTWKFVTCPGLRPTRGQVPSVRGWPGVPAKETIGSSAQPYLGLVGDPSFLTLPIWQLGAQLTQKIQK